MTLQESPKVHWSVKLQHFDRRWIFLAMAVAIVVPFLLPLDLPIGNDPRSKRAFDAVEALQKDDVVFLAAEFDPASTPELKPFFVATVLQLKRKGVKIAIATTWAHAPPLVERYIRQYLEGQIDPDGANPDPKYKKDRDYVWLGFREGKQAVIREIGDDVWRTFDNKTSDGVSLSQVSFMKGRKSLKDFDLTIVVSAGNPGAKEYVEQVQGRYGLPMIAACTAVSLPELMPYYGTGQLKGVVAGMAGAAVYEKLVGKRGSAAAGAQVLNIGHLMIILAIVFGNVIYFVSRGRS